MEDLIAALPDGLLPPGSLAAAHDGGPPRYWLSDRSAPPGLWPHLRARHTGSGLWPLLLGGRCGLGDPRPWVAGEILPVGITSPADHDVTAVLTGWWTRHRGVGAFPGLAAGIRSERHPDEVADTYAEEALDQGLRLGLTAVPRGADALAATGWAGPVNHTGDMAEISSVVRSWEERFGARVVVVGFDTLQLSVAAPPVTVVQAARVAAEHFAFCPDLVWQGAGSLEAYSASIIDRSTWWFWWD